MRNTGVGAENFLPFVMLHIIRVENFLPLRLPSEFRHSVLAGFPNTVSYWQKIFCPDLSKGLGAFFKIAGGLSPPAPPQKHPMTRSIKSPDAAAPL